MDEQPVAFAIISRSPNNCDSSLRYGSPHPAQAPENSNSGCRNCVPRTVPKSTRDRSFTRRLSKKAVFSRSAADDRLARREVDRLAVRLSGASTGHASTHSAQPVQSST